MKIIILIGLLSWLIYKKGTFANILERCKIEPEYIEETDPPEIENTYSMTAAQKERGKLEIEAAYIVKQQGHNPYTVKYMGDDLLKALIKDYIKSANNA